MAVTAFAVFLKIATLMAFLLSVAVVAGASYTLVGVFHHDEEHAGKLEDEKNTRLIPKFETMTGEYKHAVLGCVFTVLVAGGVQLLMSLCVLVSCSKDQSSRAKLWLIIHFILFLIFMICFLVPLTYDSSKGQRIDEIHKLKSKIKAHFKSLRDESLTDSLTTDLTAFFVTLGLNEGVLLILMLILACCLCTKCGTHNYEPISS